MKKGVHERKPKGFEPQVQVVACYIEIDDKLLLLQLSPRKSESGAWGVPAGKLEKNETLESAAKRELFEETGISIEKYSQVQSLGALYIRKPEVDYTFHLFRIHLDQVPTVYLSDEHQNYRWATSEDIEEMPLMEGAREALQYYRAALRRSG